MRRDDARGLQSWLWVESTHVGRSSHVFRGAISAFCRGARSSLTAKNCQSIFQKVFSGDLCNSVSCVLCAQLCAKRDSEGGGESLLANWCKR